MTKQSLLNFSLLLFIALAGGVGSAWGETVTYSVDSKSSVTVSGTAPSGSTVTYSQTYSTSCQATKDNSFTLTLSGWNNYTISNITLSMKSNKSSGAGTLKYSVDGGRNYTVLVNAQPFSNEKWHGSYTQDYVDVSKDVTIVGSTSNIVIKIEATASSLYCQSYKITYTSTGGSEAETCATPTFSPAAGTYNSAQSVTVSTTTEDASIYYTTDGTTPTASSTLYSSAIEVSEDMTIKAIAVKEGNNNSVVATAAYVIQIPHTVTLGDDSSTLTEASYGAGVTLPTRDAIGEYSFAGWSTTNVTAETTTAPTIVPVGSYTPTANVTLYPVYTRTETSSAPSSNTSSVTVSEYATSHSWGSNASTNQKTIQIDTNVTATCNAGSNSGKYYSDGWRIYQTETGKITIATTSGTLSSVTFTFTVSNTGQLKYGNSNVTSGTAVAVSGTSAEFTVGNSASAENGQVRISSISVTYTTSGSSTTYYWSNPTPPSSYITAATSLAVPNYIFGTEEPTYETLTVNGSNLTADIVLTLNENSNFEMSSDLDSWTNTLTLTQTDGSVADAEVAVRLKSGLAKGTHNGTLTLSSEGADDVVVNLSGTVTGQIYNISIDNNVVGGTIEADMEAAAEGATVTLTATPNDAYTFGSWSVVKDDLETQVTVTNNQFTMPDGEVYVSATFNAKPTYAVICAYDEEKGLLTAEPESAYEGQTVTLAFAAETGFGLSAITITKTEDGSATDITPVASGDDFTFTMPGYAVTATVIYTKVPLVYTSIALSAGQSLSFTDFSEAGSYADNKSINFPASDGDKYTFTGKQFMYNSGGAQMKKSNGVLTSGTVTTPNGYTLTITTKDTNYPTVMFGETSALVQNTDGYSKTYSTSSTSTAFTLTASTSGTAVVTGISITAMKAATTLSFAENTQAVAIGASATYAATGSREGIVYSSSDDAVATVNASTGEVTGVAEGSVTITATLAETADYDGATDTYTLTVYDSSKTITVLALEKNTYEVLEGKTLQVTPTITEGYDGTLEYESSNTDIATVAADGTVTGITKGSTTITVTAPATSGFTAASASYTLNVTRIEDIFVLDETRGWDNAADYTGDTGNYGILIPSKGTSSNQPKYYSNGTATRFYKGNTLTVSSGSKGIKKVTFDTNSGESNISVTTTGYSKSSGVITSGENKATNRVVFSFTDPVQVNAITVVYGDIETVAESVDVTFAASGYATYCSPYALDLTPADDYAAWAVTEVNGTNVVFTKIEGAVPAETPFILYGKDFGGQTATLPVASGETTAVADNMLRGTLTPTSVVSDDDFTYYGLSGGAFKKITGGTVKANKAYLAVPSASVPAGTRLNIVFVDVTTGIQSVNGSGFMGHGSEACYNLNGQRIDGSRFTVNGSGLKPGLYIVNGKKVVMK